jgi:predicted DNA-binding transcriptional regulator YafY
VQDRPSQLLRHDKLARQIELIGRLAASHAGLNIAQMMEFLGCERRTVERLIEVLKDLYGDRLTFTEQDDRKKYWRLKPDPDVIRAVPRLELTREEALEVEAAALALEREGHLARAEVLRGLDRKLKLRLQDNALRKLEPDVEALLNSEGMLGRPGPRFAVTPELLGPLREALLINHRIRLHYRTPGQATREHLLEPVGLLYGMRPYLLAIKPGKPDAAVWRLDRVESVVVTQEGFTRPEGQDLRSLTAECFGVWREPPMDVALRFTAEAAKDARGWHFHASQTVSEEPDGALVVRFRAGGIEEMAVHLVTWATGVEVLAPAKLRARLAVLGTMLAQHHVSPD